MLFRLIAPILLLFPAWSSRCQPGFVDAAGEAGLLSNSGSQGVAVADFNRDGWDDLYVTYANRANELYKNLGNGRFEEIAQSAGVAVELKSITAVWGDINNDGYPDLYVGKQSAFDQLFLNNGNETFQEITLQAGIYQVGNPFAVNMADVNNDGFLDIYVSNFLFENLLYLNNGDNTFTNFTWQAGAFDNGKSMGAVFFDYDLDGDQDLYLVHDGHQPNFLYQNDGKGVFTEVGAAAGANTASFGMGVAAGDIDNDGYPDLYITNLDKNILLKNNGDGTFSDISESAGVQDAGMGWGVTMLDYDLDGLLDIYVANDYAFSPFPNVLYHNLGNGRFEAAETEGPACNHDDSYGTACFDYDLDGLPDLVVANRSTNETLQLLRNTDRPGHWIGFKLRGTASNRDAVGARIVLTDKSGRRRTREIQAGQGWQSQNSSVLHVGLGDVDSISSLVVFWPSGLQQEIGSLPADIYFLIEEGAAPHAGLQEEMATPVVEQPVAIRPQVEVFPNPVTGKKIEIAVQLPEPEAVTLDIRDASGRLLWVADPGVLPAGESRLPLDAGRIVAAGSSGPVLLQLRSNRGVVTRKLLIRPD